MRKILVLGAGFSSPFLIRHLLDHSPGLDAAVTVADLDLEAARGRVGGHPRGRAIRIDFSEPHAAEEEIAAADLVVSLLPPHLQPEVARQCVHHGSHMVSASYRWRQIDELDTEAKEKGVAILTELGLDPGLDLMSAQRIIEGIQARGGRVDRFLSYGGGLPEPTYDGNPLRYCVTWNPRNVVMAAENGAQFLRRGRIEMQPWHRVLDSTWTVDVPGLGPMDAYANRDSITYRNIHGIERVRTLVRGTLRYPGFCQAWHLLVRLGLPNEHLVVPRLAERTWAELVEMFLPGSEDSPAGGGMKERVAGFLGIDPADARLRALDALGLFSHEAIGAPGHSPAQALVELLRRRLPLPEDVRDMVVLHHEIDALYPGDSSNGDGADRDGGNGDRSNGDDGQGPDGPRRERTLSTFVCYGDPGGTTAMATTVGFPAALGARMLLDGRLERRGCLSPTDPDVYLPILAQLEAADLRFEESTEVVPA